MTRKRLYLETMESVLPGVEKVIVKPGQVVPYLPLERAGRREVRRFALFALLGVALALLAWRPATSASRPS